MIRILRTAVPIVVLAAALAGCSSSTIDIPEGAQVTPAPVATPAVTAAVEPAPEATVPIETVPVETTPATASRALECTAVLPVETIETALGLPAGFVTASEQTDGCAWAMAGNPSALTLQALTGATEDTVAQQEASGSAASSTLGDRAFYRGADAAADPAATLVVLVGDEMITVRSYVGDQASLEELASDALTALELDPS
ncbi:MULTISPECIES: hypothetical protein [unclassified Rathayibacter]|uniref:hypothetical protein n=1 Tax=unclassified Rathayibacter TaxID=2609250 RepID=UPI000701D011|nr:MULTISPECIES: hypothetical protein [unclassified Rathayibacter]KQQ05206.1 hypothetical protein ASF42_00880 [Rathayibacter sp. Leaf294]KQS13069.1 hypothetical protein ASG06_00880 [Rathayibacter sp. Leaf185]